MFKNWLSTKLPWLVALIGALAAFITQFMASRKRKKDAADMARLRDQVLAEAKRRILAGADASLLRELDRAPADQWKDILSRAAERTGADAAGDGSGEEVHPDPGE